MIYIVPALQTPLSRWLSSIHWTALLLCIISLHAMGCGASPVSGPAIVAQTESSTESEKSTGANTTAAENHADTDTTGSPVTQLIERDAHFARDILITALQQTENTALAAWAAVYIRLLNINADAEAVERRLQTGAQSNDLLLKSLCDRWLVNSANTASANTAVTTDGIPPAEEPIDPVPGLFLTLNRLAHSTSNPEQFAIPLDVGAATSFHQERISLNSLLKQTAPFDNGPLALAIAFIDARRMSLATEVEGVTVPRSTAYRQKLLAFYNIHRAIPAPDPPVDSTWLKATGIHPLLENPLGSQPVAALRNIIVSGADSLKLNALRAMASAALQPEVGDFAAAASAFRSQNPQVRVEGARTFLLLVTRATKE